MNESEIFQKVQEEICDLCCINDKEEIQRDTYLSDLPLDSLDLADLSNKIESEFLITFQPQDFLELPTVGAVTRRIHFKKQDE